MNSYFYLAVEGPIGVGKTTLARLLQEELGGQLLLEVFEENPFLSDFYADRTRYAFQTQIFFLLSRYRQQHDVVPKALQQAPLISDYLLAKDRLFAHLNLAGDELAVYERTHAALGEQIVAPGLVIYLRADTDTLMNRIAFRDRSYERTMSRQYIDNLRVAYDRFFAEYDQAQVLNIDTNELDFVAQQEDRRYIVGLVRNALEGGPYQQPLLDLEPALAGPAGPPLEPSPLRLADYQRMHHAYDQEQGFVSDLFLNYLGLSEKIGELGKELKGLWVAQHQQRIAGPAGAAAADPLETARSGLRGELADVLAALFKVANDAGIDIEDAYLAKMRQG